MTITMKTAKKLIEDFETVKNGYHLLCGHSVEVVDVRWNKNINAFIADVTFHNDEDREHETLDDLEYPAGFLAKWKKQRRIK